MKFLSLWIEPLTIHKNLGQHTFHLQSLYGKIKCLLLNGQDLKHYFQLWYRVVSCPMYIVSLLSCLLVDLVFFLLCKWASCVNVFFGFFACEESWNTTKFGKRKEVNRPIIAYCSGRTISTMELRCDRWNFYALVKVALLHTHYHKLFYAMDRSSSTQASEWLGSHRLP